MSNLQNLFTLHFIYSVRCCKTIESSRTVAASFWLRYSQCLGRKVPTSRRSWRGCSGHYSRHTLAHTGTHTQQEEEMPMVSKGVSPWLTSRRWVLHLALLFHYRYCGTTLYLCKICDTVQGCWADCETVRLCASRVSCPLRQAESTCRGKEILRCSAM